MTPEQLNHLEFIIEASKRMMDHSDKLYDLAAPDEGKKYNSKAMWHGHEISKYRSQILFAIEKIKKGETS